MSTGRRGFEDFAWGLIAQRLVKPLVVVEQHPPADAAARLRDRDVGVDEHLFVLQAAPEAFDKDVVQIRRRPEITVSRRLPWGDGVVPLWVECIPRDVERVHFCVADLDPLGIGARIKLAAYS